MNWPYQLPQVGAKPHKCFSSWRRDVFVLLKRLMKLNTTDSKFWHLESDDKDAMRLWTKFELLWECLWVC